MPFRPALCTLCDALVVLSTGCPGSGTGCTPWLQHSLSACCCNMLQLATTFGSGPMPKLHHQLPRATSQNIKDHLLTHHNQPNHLLWFIFVLTPRSGQQISPQPAAQECSSTERLQEQKLSQPHDNLQEYHRAHIRAISR